MPPPMIAGLYPYTRGGVTSPPRTVLSEIEQSLRVNPMYRDALLVLAGDRASAELLEGYGLTVHRVFDDAPPAVRRDTAHKMKHWMCRWALAKYGEFLWVDWDTVCLGEPDDAFWSLCRSTSTPRFIRIPEYWATVNCGIYYAPAPWIDAMDRSFDAEVEIPNDELLWRSVLPDNVKDDDRFWWGDTVVHVERREDIGLVTGSTRFVHVKELDWADDLRRTAHVCVHGMDRLRRKPQS